MHKVRRLRQGLSVRVDYVTSAERDTGDFCGSNAVLSLRGCALHCGLCHRGVTPCRGTRADTNGSRGRIASNLYGRAGVPCLRLDQRGVLVPLVEDRGRRAHGERRARQVRRMRTVRTSVRDSERSRGDSSHTVQIVGTVALVIHKNRPECMKEIKEKCCTWGEDERIN